MVKCEKQKRNNQEHFLSKIMVEHLFMSKHLNNIPNICPSPNTVSHNFREINKAFYPVN